MANTAPHGPSPLFHRCDECGNALNATTGFRTFTNTGHKHCVRLCEHCIRALLSQLLKRAKPRAICKRCGGTGTVVHPLSGRRGACRCGLFAYLDRTDDRQTHRRSRSTTSA